MFDHVLSMSNTWNDKYINKVFPIILPVFFMNVNYLFLGEYVIVENKMI